MLLLLLMGLFPAHLSPQVQLFSTGVGSLSHISEPNSQAEELGLRGAVSSNPNSAKFSVELCQLLIAKPQLPQLHLKRQGTWAP